MGHWYTTKGKPKHKIHGRDTTLRDARKLNLFPSVTTVLNVQSKPGLDWYKQKKLLDACAALSEAGLSIDKNRPAAIKLAKEDAELAAKKGTQIHNILEDFINGEEVPTDCLEMCQSVIEHINEHYGEIVQAEASFCNTAYGYGGCVDVKGITPKGREFIIDFKTKDFKSDADVKKFVYDSHVMQLAAYAKSVCDHPDSARVGNVFISTNAEDFGYVLDYAWTASDYARGWEMFKSLLEFWQLEKKYGVVWDEFQELGL